MRLHARALHARRSCLKLRRPWLKGFGLPGISHFIAGLITHYGILALFVSVSLETLGAPLPGETAIILASGAAAAGKLNIYMVALTAFLAAVIGDNAAYVIGRKLGRPVILRYGRRVGLNEKNFGRMEAVVRRRGPLMVVFARFVVVLRQLNGLVAGTTRMPWLTFATADAIGAALWVGLWTTLAYRFGHSTEIVPFIWHHLSIVAAIGIPLLIGVLAYLRLWRHWPDDAQASHETSG
jgi:membrane protein DedA with SNARE-associated domain